MSDAGVQSALGSGQVPQPGADRHLGHARDLGDLLLRARLAELAARHVERRACDARGVLARELAWLSVADQLAGQALDVRRELEPRREGGHEIPRLGDRDRELQLLREAAVGPRHLVPVHLGDLVEVVERARRVLEACGRVDAGGSGAFHRTPVKEPLRAGPAERHDGRLADLGWEGERVDEALDLGQTPDELAIGTGLVRRLTMEAAHPRELGAAVAPDAQAGGVTTVAAHRAEAETVTREGPARPRARPVAPLLGRELAPLGAAVERALGHDEATAGADHLSGVVQETGRSAVRTGGNLGRGKSVLGVFVAPRPDRCRLCHARGLSDETPFF